MTVPARRCAALVEVVRDLDDAAIGIDDIGLRRPTLDDVFLSLTGHAAEEMTETERATGGRTAMTHAATAATAPAPADGAIQAVTDGWWSAGAT